MNNQLTPQHTPLALIIDDAEDLAIVYAKALQTAGFETESISDGNTALARLATAVPDLILLDLHLPGISGKQILGYIRSHPQLVNTKIIIATADLIWARELQQQVDAVLVKPVGFQKLRQLVEHLYTAS